jgi:aminoglycoside phosphotransferase
VNSLETFLKENWQRLALDRFGSPGRVSCVLATPRFRASGHVVFLVLSDWLPTPILVGKVPRLPGDDRPLAREAANLRALQLVRAGGFDCVPQLVAYETTPGQSLLLETAVLGAPVRLGANGSTSIVDKVVDWLIEFHLATMRSCDTVAEWYERLVNDPGEQFLVRLCSTTAERELVDRTTAIAAPLRDRKISLVFEHGDFSPPNILADHDGTIGIVDWELAEPDGLPALDLFFLLAATAFARDGASTEEGYVASFHRAFFGASAWARPYISRYAQRLGLSQHLLAPLFVLCWSRYVTTLAGRLHDIEGGILDSDTAAWLRSNRYYSLWNYAVTHFHDLNLYETSTHAVDRVA